MRNFVGRKDYLNHLQGLWGSRQTKLVSIYGRRRVGKTALIQVLSQGKRAYLFEALEGEETRTQVRHFLRQLAALTGEAYIADLNYTDWPPVFDLLTKKITQEKSLLLCFDELSWMASGRSRLIGYIKFYWDHHWKQHPHLLMILCGSVASWMIKNVVRSKALYGRISENFLLLPLQPSEVAEFIGNKRGKKETLEYLLCFGGIPKYLEEFDFNQSIQINIEKTCFKSSGFFVDEADKIFYNQFRETLIYKRIVRHLLEKPLYLKDISEKLEIPSGGGLKQYLDNLIAAGILEKIPALHHWEVSKTYRYYVVDEFLRFHSRFIDPHRDEIVSASSSGKFRKFTKDRWASFLGYAFERFCLKHRYLIARLLDFEEKVVGCGSLFNQQSSGYQYDLVFLRDDGVITLCEVKYVSEALSTSIIKDFEEKLRRTTFPKNLTVEKVLICNQKPGRALEESGYFHRILLADEIAGI